MSEAAPETEIQNDTPAKASPAQTGELSEAGQVFALAQRQARAMAKSELVPAAFQASSVGEERAVANCMIAMNLANRIGADPLMVAQNLTVVHGKPTFSASFLIACVNECGRFEPLQYRFSGEGDDRTCVAFTTTRDGVPVEGPPVSVAMAKAEGWWSRKSKKTGAETSKWPTMTELMLTYRSATFFARTRCPELMMGMHGGLTREELDDLREERAAASRAAASQALRELSAGDDDGAEGDYIDAEHSDPAQGELPQ